MNIVLLGRPGAGKGTQGARLAERFALTHLSTGKLLRDEVAKGTPLGRRIGDVVAQGLLVADAVVADVVAAAVAAAPDGVLLDGYPRTLDQCERLSRVLGERQVDLVIDLEVPAATIIARIRHRLVCSRCGADAGTGAVAGCSRCGGPLTRRADDRLEVTMRRLWQYERETGPVVAWFERRGLLAQVDGTGTAEQVASCLEALVIRCCPRPHTPLPPVDDRQRRPPAFVE